MSDTHNTQRAGKLKMVFRCALVAVLATALFLPINISTAYAEPTSTEKQAEADEVSAALAASEAELLQLRDDFFAAVEAHDAALLAMQEAQDRIDAAQAIILETQEKLGYRAVQMYRDGQNSFLEVIFGASTFEAFTTSWDILNTINQENAKLIQANKDAREEAEAAHAELTLQEQLAAERKAEAEAVKERAEQLVADQQALLDGLEAEVAELVAAEQAARQATLVAESPQNDYVGQPVPGGGYSDVVSAAASRIGCPYVFGGKGPDVFDCSGLTSWAYAQSGRGSIGGSDGAQYGSASASWPYTAGGAQPGDVLWWPGHVAIYAGGGSYIHAPAPGESVCYSSRAIDEAMVLRF